MTTTAWPQKTRELHNHHMDSTVWNGFAFRPDDIVIATYAKSGTTWTQQIVGQLIFGGREDVLVHDLSPWLDMRCMPQPQTMEGLEAQTHRRFIKTHLPVDALVFSPKAKYIYVGRDGRDLVWSLHNHHMSANDVWYDALNNTPGLVGPTIERPDPDIRRYFLRWLAEDGYPFWSFWDNAKSWWEVRDLPNVKLIHFSAMKRDLRTAVAEIADFLDIPVTPALLGQVTAHAGFDYMKRNANRMTPLGGTIFEGGGEAFIHKGVNGRWRDVLTPADIAAYKDRALAALGPAGARWFETGEREAGPGA
jgi:aryl sulfotransferase